MKSRLVVVSLAVTFSALGACTKTETVYVTETTAEAPSTKSYRSVDPVNSKAWDGRFSDEETALFNFVIENTGAGEQLRWGDLMTSEQVIKLGYFSCERYAEGLDYGEVSEYAVDAAASLSLEADYQFRELFAAISGGARAILCPDSLSLQDKRDLFLQDARAFSSQLAYLTDASMIELALATCRTFQAGAYSVDEYLDELAYNATSVEETESSWAIVIYGIKYFCPEFNDSLNDYLG